MKLYNDSGTPNREFALTAYRRLAEHYDRTCRLIQPVRQRTIQRLQLTAGETVIDVASGTGLSLPALSAAVGPGGHVIALELSPEMAAVAQQRISERSLGNVLQIVAPAEDAVIPCRADALLFHYTHDVLRSEAALANLMKSAKAGARVAIAGFKLPTDWRRAFNSWHRWRAWGYLSTFEGIYWPWSLLTQYVNDFQLHEENLLGSSYIASARVMVL